VRLRTAEARFLRAELDGDQAEQARILDAELTDGWWPEVLPAAFVLAARRRFGEFGNRHLVTVFARRFVDRAPGAADFSPRTVEAVIRAAAGEDWLLETVDPALGLQIMYAGLFALADDLGLNTMQSGQLLAEAEAMVALMAPPPAEEGTALRVDAGEHRRTGQRYLTDADQLPDLTRRVRSPRRPAAAPKSRKALRRLPPAPEPFSVAGRYLRALALHEKSEDRRAEVDGTELSMLALAVLVVILPRYLPADPDPREIANLVKLTWQTFRPPTDPITMEHVVRRGLREEISIHGISGTDAYTTAALVLTAIADDWQSNARAISTVIADTEAIAISEGKTLTRARPPVSTSDRLGRRQQGLDRRRQRGGGVSAAARDDVQRE